MSEAKEFMDAFAKWLIAGLGFFIIIGGLFIYFVERKKAKKLEEENLENSDSDNRSVS